MTIKSINSTDEGLEIFWSDSNVSCFPWFWLRDHSESYSRSSSRYKTTPN